MVQERRTLTILFSDLKGFTAFSEKRDPEEIKEVVDALCERFRMVIEAESGYVDKFIGDSVMAEFGVPQAHADDSLRAVRAGLEMQKALAMFNTDKSLTLALRVGINRGEVLWGETAGAPPTAIGDAVNVAQRLESACTPGKVLVSQAVEQATRGHVRYSRLGSLSVKGRQEQVQPFEVIGLVESFPSFREAASRVAPMVGRDELLNQLREKFERGKPAFLLVEGDAGIGKSRLVWEFERQLANRPEMIRVEVGHCHERLPVPLEPLAEAFHRRCGLTADVARKDFVESPHGAIDQENYAHLMALSMGVDVPEARVKHIDPSRIVAEMHHAWHMWVLAVSKDGPLVLVLEDLHWADEGTIVLLEYLATRLRDEHVMVMATRRPEGRKAPIGFEALKLDRLDRVQCRTLSEHILARHASDPLLQFVQAQTAGNPYYLEELIRYLVQNDLVVGEPATLRSVPESVPDTLNGFLVGRIDALSEGPRETIKRASVVGGTFWLRILSNTMGRDVRRDLEELVRGGMVFERSPSRLPSDTEYAFKHALLRDAAYSLLTKRDRVRLHAIIARVLETEGGMRAKGLAADHWEHAGERVRAVALFRDAAEEAAGRSSYAEGLEYATRAGAHLLRANALTGLSRYDEALTAARTAPLDEKVGALLAEAVIHLRRGAFQQVIEAAEEALRLGANAKEEAEALRRRAAALDQLGRSDEAMADAEKSLRRAREIGDQRGVAASLNNLGLVLHNRGAHEAAMAAHEESLAIRRQFGDRYGIAASLNNISLVHYSRGAYEAAMTAREESLAIWRQIGDRYGIAASLSNIGLVHYRRGKYEAAMEAHEESLVLRREIGDQYGIAASLDNIGVVDFARRTYDAAMAAHEESLEIRRHIGDRPGIHSSLLNIGNIHYAQGAFEPAMTAHEEALRIAREMKHPEMLAASFTGIGAVHVARGETAKAIVLYEEALSLAREAKLIALQASALSGLGEAYLHGGDLVRGIALLGEATALWERHGLSASHEACEVRDKLARAQQ